MPEYDRADHVGPEGARREFLTREEAAAFLGVDVKRLDPVLEEYGIARRYLIDPNPDWYYARADLQKVGAGTTGRASPPRASEGSDEPPPPQ